MKKTNHSLLKCENKKQNQEKYMCVKMAIQSKGKRLIFNVSSIPKWDQLLKKRIHYSRSEFFSLRVDPILDSGQQRKIPQLFPFVKMAEKNVVHQCTVVSFLQN